MSISGTFDRIPCRLLTLLAFGALANATFASTADRFETCSAASPVESAGKAELTGIASEQPDCYRIAIREAGWLWVQATVPVRAVVEPRVQRLAGCESEYGKPLSAVQQAAGHLLIHSSSANSAVVCVSAQDPLLHLDRYTLVTAFLPQGQMDPELIEFEPEHQSSYPVPVDPELIEFEPEHQSSYPVLADPELIEFEPEHQSSYPVPADPELIEFEPEHQSSSPSQLTACSSLVQDDHADTFFCASAVGLGGSTRGRLQAGNAPDQDYFSFRIGSLKTVRFEVTGDADLFAGLYDERGRRLASVGELGQRAALQLTRTLEQGTYFIRIEGAGWSEGDYAMSLREVPSLW